MSNRDKDQSWEITVWR